MAARAGSSGSGRHASYDSTDQQLEILSGCMRSGESQKWNSSYKSGTQSHPYEDTSFRFTFGGDTLYGVLDGHDGLQVAHFARNTLVSELCTGLRSVRSPDRVPSVIESCILDVDRRLHQRFQPLLEERAVIKVKIAGAPNSYEAYLANPKECERLSEIEDQIKGGTTVATAIIHNNTLYTANVGDSRIILCTYQEGDGNSNVEFRVDQLTEDHTTANDNELERLEKLGLNKQQIQEKRRVGSMETTRSIGDFAVKWGYKDFDILSDASAPPVIALPHCTGGLPVDRSFYFLFLMSDGVYHAVEEMSDCDIKIGESRTCPGSPGSPDPNIRIANLLHDQFKKHKDCQKAADSVLEYICQQHFDAWSYGCGNCCRRDDMTLLVRLFNSPSKLYGHKRNHSGTIFRSSFSYCSSSDGITPQPQTSSGDLLAELSKEAPVTRPPGTQSSMPPLTLTNALSILSPSDVEVEDISFDPATAPFEPYIHLGADFPDDSMMDFILKKVNVPEALLDQLTGGQ